MNDANEVKEDAAADRDASKPEEFSLDGANRLLELLLRRGYFHDHAGKAGIQTEIEGDDLETFRRMEAGEAMGGAASSAVEVSSSAQSAIMASATAATTSIADATLSTQPHKRYQFSDKDCRLIPLTGDEAPTSTSSSPMFCTREALVKQVHKYLEDNHHRMTTHDLCGALRIRPACLTGRLMDHLPSHIQIINDDLIGSEYWDITKRSIQQAIVSKGSLPLKSIVDDLKLPLHVVEANCIPALQHTFTDDADAILRLQKPSGTCFCSGATFAQLKASVIATFQTLQQPTSVLKLCQEHDWDQAFVVDWIQDPVISKGDLHCDDLTSAQFIPHAHTHHTHESIMALYSANGFVTADLAGRLHGVLPNEMMQIIQQQAPDATVLQATHCVVAPRVLQDLQMAMLEAVSSECMVDLQDHVPLELLNQPNVIEQLLEHSDVAEVCNDCLVIVVEGQAIASSKRLNKKIVAQELSDIIESYAKQRAVEIDAIIQEKSSSAHKQHDADNDDDGGRKRSKRKGKRDSKRKSSTSNHADNELNPSELAGVAPLLQVVGAVSQAYPMLIPDEFEDDLLEQAMDLIWDSDVNSGILAVEFCRRVVYTPSFQSKCQKAVLAELDRLRSLRTSKASLSRKDAAAKVRSVEGAFEEFYVDACYMLQAGHKFIQYAADSPLIEDGVLRSEFLRGPCADLTTRLTQYALFQEEDEAGIFSFVRQSPSAGGANTTAGGADVGDGGDDNVNERERLDDHADSNEINAGAGTGTAEAQVVDYCQPVDISAIHHVEPYFSCPPPREPLPVLRETLSSTNGVALARLWVLCGGETYLGGTRTNEQDGSVYVRPGKLEEFIEQVQENCLTICGFPFKKLDKKSEKQFLFQRRQQLQSKLLVEHNARAVLQWTVMILYQQVKQYVVSGDLLVGPIRQMLQKERKIPQAVSELLEHAAQLLERDEEMTHDVLEAVRECGMCKDISKHTPADVGIGGGSDA